MLIRPIMNEMNEEHYFCQIQSFSFSYKNENRLCIIKYIFIHFTIQRRDILGVQKSSELFL